MSYIKWLWMICVCILSLSLEIPAYAKEAAYQGADIKVEGFQRNTNIYDGNRDTYSTCGEENRVTISRPEGIGSIYIEFDRIPGKWTITNPQTQVTITCGENGYLHEYVDVKTMVNEVPQELVLTFSEGTSIADIYVFSEGTVPEWVQIWNPPHEETDLMLLSSHSDDEQLFFAGVLPYYTIERKMNVQVVYVVQHFEANGAANHQRPHEQLDGLWKVGVRNYPIMSEFPDLYAESKDRETALKQMLAVYQGAGYTYEDFVEYFTECIRRCKPLVIVSHDPNGEYGHGTHVLCVEALKEALECAGQEEKFPESAKLYGTWEVEKTYLHLYEENPIVMDFDVPLESLGGKTAFQVTQEGFGCHKSQHWTWFYKWMYGTADRPIKKAADIVKYSPCYYGLYDSKVGIDCVGGDFMENIQAYEERALEAARKTEEERLAAEAAKAKEEEERLLREQKELEALKQKEMLEEKQRKEAAVKTTVVSSIIGFFLSICMVWIWRRKKKK